MRNRMTVRNKPFFIDLKAGQTYQYCMCKYSEFPPLCDKRSHRGRGISPMAFTVEKDAKYYICGCKESKSLPFCDGTHKNR